jgi:histidine triad (HIT) family protein
MMDNAAQDSSCLFCRMIAGTFPTPVVYRSEIALAFLDHRPIFPGHCLVVPIEHVHTLSDLPSRLVGPFFSEVQLVNRAVQTAMGSQGTLVAMNNNVSQSVPHLHAHVVPRDRKDGFRGFFWPRSRYENEDEMERVRARIAHAAENIRPDTPVS